jgi:putative drug exporter of the RND superfamily
VTNVLSPLGQTTEGRISPDGRSALIGFDMRSDPETAADRVQPVIDATAAVQKAHPDLFIAGFGSASAVHELPETVDKDVQRAETLSLPITLLILLVAFGALVPAGLPVILAFSGVLAATGLSALFSHVVPASDSRSP